MAASIRATFGFAARTLLKSPGFTIVVILALALGIGANTAIFSGVSALLLGPMPYADPERLVAIWENAAAVGFPRNTPAPGNYNDWRHMNRVFTDIAALRYRVANVTGDAAPEMVLGKAVTPNFFDVLGSYPKLGRTFTADEDGSRANVVVISYAFWQRWLHGDPKVIGRTLRLDDQPYRVVGVMPSGFAFPDRQFEYWEPAHFTAKTLAQRQSHFLQVVGRLKPGVSVGQAQADMDRVASQLEKEHPDSNRQLGAVVIPLREQLVGNTRTAFLALLGASALVLLIACTNISNLLLTRNSERGRELALRVAIGASRLQILGLVLSESVLLSVVGAALGLLFASVGIKALQALIPPDLVNASNLSIDVRVLCFTIAASFVSGILFAVAPAWKAAKVDLNESLKQGGRTATAASGRLRKVLVAAEVSMAAVLLCGAGLLIQTLSNLQSVDLGFNNAGLLTMTTPLSPHTYDTDAKTLAFVDQVLAKVSTLPGIRGAAYASDLPFTSVGDTAGFRIEGRAPSPDDQFNDALYREVTNNYLQTLGVRLLSGRLLDSRDSAYAPFSIVINETFARRYWPRSNPIGARLRLGATKDKLYTIVGVIADVRERGLQLDMKPAMYLAFPQVKAPGAVYLLVRTAVDPKSLASTVRTAIWSIDPRQPIARVRTMDELAAHEIRGRKQHRTIFAIFAGLALFLAALGIYGLLAYFITRRRREIGVRFVLGASRASITGLVLSEGLLLMFPGLIAGALLAVLLMPIMRSLLFGVRPLDPATYLTGASVLVLAGLTASLLPIVSVSRVNPALVLRDE